MWATFRKNTIDAQVEEIRQSKTLLSYGVALALIHVSISWSWTETASFGPLAWATRKNALEALCWPILGSCARLHLMSGEVAAWSLRLYALIALVAAGAFVTRRTALGYFALAGALAIELFFYVQDYRFGNELTYLGWLTTLVFLFVPGKLGAIRLLLVAMYVFVGLVHIDPSWLTGEGFDGLASVGGVLGWTWTHGLWTVLASYFVVLSAIFSFGLLMPAPQAFWPVLVQLATFHAVTAPLLGRSETLVLLLLITIFPLGALFDRTPHRITLPAFVVVAVYAFFQVLPWVTPGDSRLTGEGRVGAVVLFEGAPACRSTVIARFDDRTIDFSRDSDGDFERPSCDPYVKFRALKKACETLREEAGFRALAWRMHARRGRSREMRPIVRLDDVCGSDVAYAWLGFNPWITR